MTDEHDEHGDSLPMVELNALRMEAMALYERCLTDNSPAAFERFLERQLVQAPPPTALLNEISDDLFQRLQSLRQSQFELRDRLLRAVLADHQLELGALLSLDDFDQLAQVQSTAIVARIEPPLPPRQSQAVIQLIDQIRQTGLRLGAQRALTQELYETVIDWASALHVVTVRQQWASPNPHIVQNVWSSAL